MDVRPRSKITTKRLLPATWLLLVIAGGTWAAAAASRRMSASRTASTGELPRPARPGPDFRGPPRLRLATDHLELGRLSPGETRRASMRWWRDGARPLAVVGLRPGCSCTAVKGLPRDLPAGANGLLRVSVRAPTRPGPFVDRVRIVTDADALRVQTLCLRGHVTDDVVARPSVLALGTPPAGESVERRIEIVATPEAARQSIHCTLQGVNGTVRVETPFFRNRPGWGLHVRLALPAEPGPIRGVLEVAVGAGTKLQIPVRGLSVRR